MSASGCISKLAQWRTPISSLSLLDLGLQVRFQTGLITASKGICKLAPLWPPSASLSSPDLGLRGHLQTYSITASNCISEFTRLRVSKCMSEWNGSRPPNAYPKSIDLSASNWISVHSISASKCISKRSRFRPPIESLSSLDLALQVHLQSCAIMASKCFSEITQSSSFGAPRIALKYRLQPVQIYRV